MKRILTIGFIIAALLATAAPGAFATTVDWKGLTWTIRGAANSAVVDGGYLAISVVGGSSGDPSPDNWAVYAKPAGAMWMEFTFTDPGGASSPRAYASGHIVGGGEMLMQGGVRAPTFPTTYTNMNVALSDTNWPLNNWNQPYLGRPLADHTFKVGLGSNGEVDFFYDGNLVEAYRIGQSYFDKDSGTMVPFTWQSDYLNIAYLGVRAAENQTGTIIYKDFQWGTEYQPVPLPGTLVLLGSGLTGLVLWRRRQAILNKG